MSAARAVYRSLSSSAQAMLGGIETDKVSSADVELSWNAAEELIASDDTEPRILSIDDLMGGRARVALGLASEEEESERARNELFDTVYDDQRKRNWPGL